MFWLHVYLYTTCVPGHMELEEGMEPWDELELQIEPPWDAGKWTQVL